MVADHGSLESFWFHSEYVDTCGDVRNEKTLFGVSDLLLDAKARSLYNK